LFLPVRPDGAPPGSAGDHFHRGKGEHHDGTHSLTRHSGLKVSAPGQIEGNVVFTSVAAFHPDKAKVAAMEAHYQAGGLGVPVF